MEGDQENRPPTSIAKRAPRAVTQSSIRTMQPVPLHGKGQHRNAASTAVEVTATSPKQHQTPASPRLASSPPTSPRLASSPPTSPRGAQNLSSRAAPNPSSPRKVGRQSGRRGTWWRSNGPTPVSGEGWRVNSAPPTAGRPPPKSPAASTPRPQTSTQRDRDEYNQALKVYVTGYPTYTQPQDLIREFSQFGNLKIDKLTANYSLLIFSTAQEAQNAIKASGKVTIYGEYLTIKQDSKASPTHKGNKRDFTRTKQKGIIVEPKEIDLSGDFGQQANQIVYTVRLTQDEANAISALYCDVERVLQALWPGCVATPFGSITTGLGIKTSDADCFVLVPDRYQHGYANFVNKAKKVLQMYPQIFAEILSIPRANTPIVKFFHVPTETNCDLSFKTPLGSQNSKLISFLLHVDPRLIPMAILIKYWAKVHELSGTGKLTNYALTMMIIFYLQQPPAAILPSVAWLQMDRNNDYIVDYWNTGFMNKKELLPPSYNSSGLADLLGGFFEYYSNFNFEECVVCPFLGTPIKKDCFKDINQLPAAYERYKQNVTNGLVMPMRYSTAICVQDPFEQSHNVASGISNRFAEDIRAFFKFAATAYQNEKSKKCENFLRIILFQKPKITRTKSNPEFRVRLFPRIIANIADPDWKSVLRDIIFTIFESIFKLRLSNLEEKENVQKESKKEREKYTTVLTKSIWKRKQFTRLYSGMHLSFVEKHSRITEEIMKADKNTTETHFQLTVTFSLNTKSAVLSLKFIKGDSDAFREFGKFFTSIIQNWVTVLTNPNGPNKPQNVDLKETIEAIDHNLDTSNDSDDDMPENECGFNKTLKK